MDSATKLKVIPKLDIITAKFTRAFNHLTEQLFMHLTVDLFHSDAGGSELWTVDCLCIHSLATESASVSSCGIYSPVPRLIIMQIVLYLLLDLFQLQTF
jgi:hypothetical protein